MKSLFISPHYDDAVFSCGKLISIMEDPTVLTVFGGVPETENVVTAYDQKSGFNNAKEAVESRREEDRVALSVIGARQIWFDIPENQYGQQRDNEEIKNLLKEQLEEYDEIYIPLGLLHPDHEVIGTITRSIIDKDKTTYIYMDLPYYVDNPELAVEAIKKIKKLEYAFRGGDLGKKMIAVSCYRSQVPITNIYHLMADERYYKLT